MARQFDRPAAGNLATPAQQVRYFDKFLTALEAVNADVASQLAAITALQTAQATLISDLAAAVADITTAQAAADAAQTAADTVTLTEAITSSYTAPGVTLSAADAGTDATITIIDHIRVYGDATNVNVTGGTITAQPYSTDLYVYYDDPTRAGGAVTYQISDNPNDALPNAQLGRHFVGAVTTPAAAGAPTSGGTAPPSSGGSVGSGRVPSSL
jgi:hypothetical protein